MFYPLPMSYYLEQIKKAENRRKKKQQTCEHTLDDRTIYRRCRECGKYVPFMDPEYKKYRGESCDAPDYE